MPTTQEGAVATDTISYTYHSVEQYSEYSLPAESRPKGITTGAEGNLWFTEWNTSKIGKITPTGSVTEYQLPAKSYPGNITLGPDHNLWYTEGLLCSPCKIGKITPSGKVTEYKLGEKAQKVYGITVGPDGNIWFTEEEGIGKITTSVKLLNTK